MTAPHWLSAAIGYLPVRALAQILEQGYTPVAHVPPQDFLVLLAWATVGIATAIRRFRWT